jgi:hypothetical protein
MSPVRAKARGARRGLVQALRRYDPAARLAIASFLWATLLGPALHLIDHRADHDHGAGAPHAHGPSGRPHHHAAAAAPPRAGTAPVAHQVLDDGQAPAAPALPLHGAGQALHFGIALLEGTPVVALVAPTASEPLAPTDAASNVVPRRRAAANRPRGPPAPSLPNLAV